MSLDKAIQCGKEYRKPYRRSKAHFRSCRNHGRCDRCRRSRTFFDRRARARADFQE
jgi:hypothetical protein